MQGRAKDGSRLAAVPINTPAIASHLLFPRKANVSVLDRVTSALIKENCSEILSVLFTTELLLFLHSLRSKAYTLKIMTANLRETVEAP